MKKQTIKIICILTTMLIVDSCAKFSSSNSTDLMSYKSAAWVQQGDSSALVRNKIPSSPNYEFDYKDNSNKTIKYFVYRRCLGKPPILNGGYKQFDIFLFTFIDDKLYYWGSLDDFKRSSNKEVNDYANIFVKEFKEKLD